MKIAELTTTKKFRVFEVNSQDNKGINEILVECGKIFPNEDKDYFNPSVCAKRFIDPDTGNIDFYISIGKEPNGSKYIAQDGNIIVIDDDNNIEVYYGSPFFEKKFGKSFSELADAKE